MFILDEFGIDVGLISQKEGNDFTMILDSGFKCGDAMQWSKSSFFINIIDVGSLGDPFLNIWKSYKWIKFMDTKGFSVIESKALYLQSFHRCRLYEAIYSKPLSSVFAYPCYGPYLRNSRLGKYYLIRNFWWQTCQKSFSELEQTSFTTRRRIETNVLVTSALWIIWLEDHARERDREEKSTNQNLVRLFVSFWLG